MAFVQEIRVVLLFSVHKVQPVFVGEHLTVVLWRNDCIICRPCESSDCWMTVLFKHPDRRPCIHAAVRTLTEHQCAAGRSCSSPAAWTPTLRAVRLDSYHSLQSVHRSKASLRFPWHKIFIVQSVFSPASEHNLSVGCCCQSFLEAVVE